MGRSLSLGFGHCPKPTGLDVKPAIQRAESLGLGICLPGYRDARHPDVSVQEFTCLLSVFMMLPFLLGA